MKSRLTLGQYYNADSVIHRLDPRLKIRFVLCCIILLFIGRSAVLFAFLTAVCMAGLVLSKVPVRHLIKGTGKLMLIMCLLNLVNLFMAYGEVLVRIGFISITREGAERYMLILWRFVLMIIMASLLMYTTLPSQLADGFAKCFHLSGETAMSVTIALRFIPLLVTELDSIRDAVKSRGVDFKSGSVKHRLSAFKFVAVPMFRSAVDKAGNLSEAMEARCYRGAKGRTRLKPLAYGVNDLIGYALLAAVIAAAIWIKVKLS